MERHGGRSHASLHLSTGMLCTVKRDSHSFIQDCRQDLPHLSHSSCQTTKFAFLRLLMPCGAANASSSGAGCMNSPVFRFEIPGFVFLLYFHGFASSIHRISYHLFMRADGGKFAW